MATLAPTAGDIGHALPGDLLRDVQLEASTAVTQFQVVYEDSAGTWQIATNGMDLSSKQEGQIGIALHAAPAGKQVTVLTQGALLLSDDNTVDVTGLVHAETYVVGAAGAIEAIGDQSSSDHRTLVGYGVDYDTDDQYGADALVVKFIPTGQQVP